jgi:outer membrane biogenesis lipoprotein LolB
MTQLQYWLRGVPVPEVPAQIGERDGAGNIRQLEQDGWRVSYDYYPPGQMQGLPRRVDLAGASQTMRMVIDTWRAPE